MFTEQQCEPSLRFLQSIFILSDKTIKYWKQETIKRCQNNKELEEAYGKYINWNRSGNEIVVFTSYAYADLLVPKKFDCIFKYDNPEHYVNVPYELTQSILDGVYPMDFIGNGHKHLCVLSFISEVPEIFKTLYVENKQYFSGDFKNMKILGLCKISDIQHIIEKHKKEIKLKEIYGDNWYDFYSE